MTIYFPTNSQLLHIVCKQVLDEQKTDEISTLSKPQLSMILDVLKTIDLSTPVQRKRLIEEIQGDLRITKIVHLAIHSNNDYQAFAKELTNSFLNHLENTLNISDAPARATAVNEWLGKHQLYFNRKTLELLEQAELYRLITLLIHAHLPDNQNYQLLFQNLPEEGLRYVERLQLPLSDFWKKTCESHASASPKSTEERYTALAYYIACKKLPMTEVAQQLDEKELLELLPHLRYGNFTGMESCKAEQLLSTVTTLPYIELLNVQGLNVTTLPDLPICNTFNCSRCTALTTLPDLPRCRSLVCMDCTHLQRLPELLPVCIMLLCSGCTNLQELPQAMPVCQYLYCPNCPSLSIRIPDVPLGAAVFTGYSSFVFNKMIIDTAEIDSNPKKIILELGAFLLHKHPFPHVYYITEGTLSQAIDMGGVKRDFISRLISSLFCQKQPNNHKLALDHEGYPLLKTKEDIDCFRTVGRLLALCYPAPSSFKIGPRFSLEFYKKLALLALAPWITTTPINALGDDDASSTYLQFRGWSMREWSMMTSPITQEIDILSLGKMPAGEQALTTAAHFLDLDLPQQELPLFFTDPKNRTLLRNTIIETAKDDQKFLATAYIAQEIHAASTTEEWEQLCSQGGKQLRERIQGKLSASLLLTKLQIECKGSTTPILQLKTVGYLHNWIAQAAIEELRMFVRAVTSSNALGPDPIIVEIYMCGPQYVPVAHTCVFTIVLSAEYPDQKTFNEKIKLFLEEGLAKSGFQIS